MSAALASATIAMADSAPAGLRGAAVNQTDNLKDTRCPQLSMTSFLSSNKQVCNDRNTYYSYYHVYWDMFLTRLPSGINWHALWGSTAMEPKVAFTMCQEDDGNDYVGEVSLQWQNGNLPTYPHHLNGNLHDDQQGACAPVPTLCPFSAQDCGSGSDGAPNCTSCMDSFISSDQPKWTYDLHNLNNFGNAIAAFEVQIGCASSGEADPANFSPFQGDICTKGQASYYHIDQTNEDVFVTGGCASSQSKCLDKGSPYCCADGSPTKSTPADCSGGTGVTCFDCSGVC